MNYLKILEDHVPQSPAEATCIEIMKKLLEKSGGDKSVVYVYKASHLTEASSIGSTIHALRKVINEKICTDAGVVPSPETDDEWDAYLKMYKFDCGNTNSATEVTFTFSRTGVKPEIVSW